MTALLAAFRSKQTRSSPDFFLAMTKLDTHWEGIHQLHESILQQLLLILSDLLT
jgi:hypothetical protein